MNLEEALQYFDTKKDLADYLGIKKQSITDWGNELPKSREQQIAHGLMKGELKMIPYIKRHGLKLIENNYSIVPIPEGKKYPSHIKEWETIEADEKLVEEWSKNKRFGNCGIGVKTQNTPAIDLDIYNENLKNLLVEWCEKNIGKTVQRIGKHPKALLVYRAEEPFQKISSNSWLDSKQRVNQVEILGDGQQFVAYGIHPDTKAPYEWVSEKELVDLNAEDLPILTREKAFALIDYFEKMKPLSFVLKQKKFRKSSVNLKKGESYESWLANFKNPKNVGVKDIVEALEQLDSEDYDFWVLIGMALYHEFDGNDDGFDLWNEWSLKSSNYDPDQMRYKWGTFKENYLEQEPVTISTLFFYVKQGQNFSESYEWKKQLRVTEKGDCKQSLHNVELILSNDPEINGAIYYNEMLATECVSKSVLDTEKGPIVDEHLHAIRGFLSTKHQFEVSLLNLNSAILNTARKHKFHPVKNYLEQIEWDEISRVETLWTDYLGEEDSPYTRETAKCFMIAAIKRIYEPQCKWDHMPIISGKQGVRKSTFWKTLAVQEEWFVDNVDMHDQNATVEKIQGAWIIEFQELQGFSRADVSAIKSFISMRKDDRRLAYGIRKTKLPRKCVFVGTDNVKQNLTDPTGARRFWPLECNLESIDIDRLKKNLDQLWAEALVLYKQNPDQKLCLTPEVEKLAAKRQEDSTVDDSMTGEIEEWLEQKVSEDENPDKSELRAKVCIRQIKEQCLELSESKLHSNSMSQKIGIIMEKMAGWKKAKNLVSFPKYGRQRAYIRVGSIYDQLGG